MVNRKDKCSKRDFRQRETLGYLLAKEKKLAERQSLSRELITGAKEELEGMQRKGWLVVKKRRETALSEPGGQDLRMTMTKDVFVKRLRLKLKKVMPDGLNHSPQRKRLCHLLKVWGS